MTAAHVPDGIEGLTDVDRDYRGSLFSDVQTALFSNPYQRIWGSPTEPPLPVYEVTLGGVLRGLLPFGPTWLFRSAAERTIDSMADLRWGPDKMGFRRLLHPNGICLTGQWKITEATPYSGYFSKGSQGLTVARYSTCCRETRRGRPRSLALAGKLFPTVDSNHLEPVHTASFITQQDIGGDSIDYINDAELRNAPNTTALRRGFGLPILIITGAVFNIVDKKPSIRQLYEIAELGKPKDEPTRAPTYMRLLVDQGQPRISGENLDFRDELMAQIYDRGVPSPKRKLVFRIQVTDKGETAGPSVYERRTFSDWRDIGKITFGEAVASYNGDFVIHFHHPTWRDDQNDPTTATRVNARKVR